MKSVSSRRMIAPSGSPWRFASLVHAGDNLLERFDLSFFSVTQRRGPSKGSSFFRIEPTMTARSLSQNLVITCALFASFVCSAAAQEAGSAWKAGTASVIITPEQSTWMAGYAFRNRPSEGKAQDLFAKALALEDATLLPGPFAPSVEERIVGKVHELVKKVRAT
jgi:hypothetical protein